MRAGFAIAVVVALALLLGGPRGEPTEPDSMDAKQAGSAPERAPTADEIPRAASRGVRAHEIFPPRRNLIAARDYAAGRPGHVSFAVVDTRGRMNGFRPRELFPAASVVKALVLAAWLRDPARRDAEFAPDDRDRLAAMIRWSDNDAADSLYDEIGDEAMIAVAEAGGMRGFTIAGHWGNAQITAGDSARFMWQLERLLPRRHRNLAMRLLAGIVADQRWGIPEAAAGWRAWFKGGWVATRRGELVSQAALLRRGPRRISVAILTDGQTSHAAGRETLDGIARRLLLSR